MNTEDLLKKSTAAKDEIYSKYASLIKSSNAGYNNTIASLGKDLRKNKRTVSAKAMTDRMNYDSSFADKGLSRSGESAQAKLLTDNAATAAIGELDRNYTDEKGRLVSEMNEAASRLAAEGSDKAMNIERGYISDYYDQKNADREYGLAERKQTAAEKNADREYVLAERKQAADEKNADREHYLAVQKQNTDRFNAFRDYELEAKKQAADEKNSDRNYELSARKQSYDEKDTDRSYELSKAKQTGDADTALLNYYLNIEKEKNAQKNKEKELLLELAKFNTDTAMANRNYELDKAKTDNDYRVKLRTLQDEEDQNYFENQIEDQYLSMAWAKLKLQEK